MSDMCDQADGDVWYKNGLSFRCTGCGKCCTGFPGYVWVDEDEIQKMAEFLGISIDLFKRKYTRQRDNRYALIELPSRNFDCIFLQDKQCRVYAVRPRQCRTFPFWKEHLKSKTSWEHVATQCEGINDSAPLVNFEDIQKQLPK
jgi:Fe-S-cluster containining protein